MQAETLAELSAAEELDLTAEAASEVDGPDWVLFTW